MVDKRGSTVNRVWERETGKSVTEPLRACVFRREPSLAQDPGFVSSAMKLPRMGGSFEEASRVLQGRSENTDSPGVSQTRLRTVRTEVWPSRCSAGRICKARMEGLPGFRSLSTAPCPPPASRLGRPSYPTLGRPLLSLCWLRSPSHVDTQEPPRAASWLPLLRPWRSSQSPAPDSVKSREISQVLPWLKTLCRPHALPAPPHYALSATRVLLSSLQTQRAYPSKRISQAAPLPSKLPLFFQLLLSICVSARRSRPSYPLICI